MIGKGQSKKSEGGAKSEGAASPYHIEAGGPPQKREWNKLLPKKLAEQLTKGQQEAIASDYREAVDTYYRVIAEKAKQQQK